MLPQAVLSTMLGLCTGRGADAYLGRVMDFLRFLMEPSETREEQTEADMEICQENGQPVEGKDSQCNDTPESSEPPPAVTLIASCPSVNCWLRATVTALRRGEAHRMSKHAVVLLVTATIAF